MTPNRWKKQWTRRFSCDHPQHELRYIGSQGDGRGETHTFLCGACGDHVRETERRQESA